MSEKEVGLELYNEHIVSSYRHFFGKSQVPVNWRKKKKKDILWK